MKRTLLVLVLACVVASESVAQSPLPGRAIRARNGDTILVPGDATVTVVRTIEGRIKLASHADGRC